MAGSGVNWIVFEVEPASRPFNRPAIYEDRVAWVEWTPSSQNEIPEKGSIFKNPPWLAPPNILTTFANWSFWTESELERVDISLSSQVTVTSASDCHLWQTLKCQQNLELPVSYRVMVYDLVTGQIWDLIDELPPCGYDFIDMYGDWVITQQQCSQELETIHGFNLQTNEYLQIAPYEGDLISHQLPSIDENYVVWVDVDGCCSSDIRMFDLDTRTTISVTNDGGGGTNYEYFPDKSGDWVVWASGGSFDIFAYNLVTSEKITITNDSATQWYPRIDGDIVVWTDQRNDYGDIYGYDLTTRQEFLVVNNPGGQVNQAIHGNLVTWTDYRDETFYISALDMATGEYFDIHAHPPNTNIYEPSMVYGDRVVWRYTITVETYLYTAKRLRFQSYLPIVLR